MIISKDVRIPFPRFLVYTTYRDKLLDIVHYIPNLRSVEVKSRREEDQLIYCVNEWHGGGKIPVALRSLLSEEMLSWTEFDTWDESEYTLLWQIQTHAFTEAVSCSGTNYFIDDNGATIIKNQGELRIDPKQIQGLPKILASRVAAVVEDFLGKQIEPNLLEMSKGVRQYLERKDQENRIPR